MHRDGNALASSTEDDSTAFAFELLGFLFDYAMQVLDRL